MTAIPIGKNRRASSRVRGCDRLREFLNCNRDARGLDRFQGP